jgi:type III secretory pathway component EscR
MRGFRGYELSEEQYVFYVGYLLLNITPVLIIGIVVSSILDALGIEKLFNKLSE